MRRLALALFLVLAACNQPAQPAQLSTAPEPDSPALGAGSTEPGAPPTVDPTPPETTATVDQAPDPAPSAVSDGGWGPVLCDWQPHPLHHEPCPDVVDYRRSTPPTTAAPVQSWADLPYNGDVWWALAVCESGGNPTTNTGNGFYGAFQFMLSTWHGIGEDGYPHDYSYEHQRAAAQRLQARSGWGQWPACSASLGLR